MVNQRPQNDWLDKEIDQMNEDREQEVEFNPDWTGLGQGSREDGICPPDEVAEVLRDFTKDEG